jgi:hypothetical protein
LVVLALLGIGGSAFHNMTAAGLAEKLINGWHHEEQDNT